MTTVRSMLPKRSVFLVSDHTGITVQTIAKTLLSQFDGVTFERVLLPFTDTVDKVHAVRERIDTLAVQSGQRPIVLSSLTDSTLRKELRTCQGLVLDVFDAFIGALEQELQASASKVVGRAHGLVDKETGRRRIQALKFALQTDDGVKYDDYPNADIILLGVSRSGKTPACLYLAMQYGLRAANYPLTEDDLEWGELPKLLRPYKNKLCGLLVEPQHLASMREERQPGSVYASLAQCKKEIRATRELFQTTQIPFLDVSHMSVEEMASHLVKLIT